MTVPTYIYDNISPGFSLKWEMFQIKFVEKVLVPGVKRPKRDATHWLMLQINSPYATFTVT